VPVELGLNFLFFSLGTELLNLNQYSFFGLLFILLSLRMVCTSLLAATPLWFIPDAPWVESLFVFWWHFDSFTRQAWKRSLGTGTVSQAGRG